MSENPEDKELLRLRKILKDNPKRVPPESFYQGVFARIEAKEAEKKNAWWGFPAKALASACVVMLALWVTREKEPDLAQAPELTPQSTAKQDVPLPVAGTEPLARRNRFAEKKSTLNEARSPMEADKEEVQVADSLREQEVARAAPAPAALQKKRLGYEGSRSLLARQGGAGMGYAANTLASASEDSAVRIDEWKGNDSGITSPLQVVIRSEDEWQALWRAHRAYTNPSPAPTVDFNRSIVIGIFMGEHGSGGYSVKIVDVRETNSECVVYFEEHRPKPDETHTTVITQPYELKIIPRTSLPIRFQKS